MAQVPVSFLLMATNSRTGLSSRIIFSPVASRFHLNSGIEFTNLSVRHNVYIYPTIRIDYLLTMGSAAWLGPHLPSNPLPIIPVLPTGFLHRESASVPLIMID